VASRKAGSTCAGRRREHAATVFRRASKSSRRTSRALGDDRAGDSREHDGNIDNIRMTRRARDFTDVQISLEVNDLKHLTHPRAIGAPQPMVAKAERG